MKNNILKLAFSALLLVVVSCTPTDIQLPTDINDVYVSGSKANHAAYWKNSTLTLLTDAGCTTSRADTLLVRNNDIHLLGTGEIGGVEKKLYWKNNILTNLTDAFSTPTELATIYSMDVDSNNDVYFGGITQNTSVTPNTYDLVYWKNGVKYTVDSFATKPFSKTNVKVFNNIVYTSIARMVAGNLVSGYYSNTTFHPVSGSVWGVAASLSSVYIYGNDLANTNYFYTDIMTNTSSTFTSNANTNGIIYNICFEGSDIYTVNTQYVYKNGAVFYTVPPATAAFDYARIENMGVKNNSLYVLNEQVGAGGVDQSVVKDGVVVQQNATDELFTSLLVN